MRTTFRKILNQSSLLARMALTLLATSIFASTAFAEPPSRVGRVSLVEGNVSFFMDRGEGWKPARINFPVTTENSLWTEGASRAEVRIGPSAMRLDDNTILDFIRIDDDQTLAYLQRGSVNIRTRRDGGDGRETLSVETADGRFVVEANGRYRIDAADNGAESRISVYAGRARFEPTDNNANSVTVDRGRTLVVEGLGVGRGAGQSGANRFRFETTAESGFDRWADARDRTWDRTHSRYVSSQVVSSYMTGYEELDTHGDWIDSGEYGRVWSPRYVSSGWAPYRNGSWSYVSPWGWTWVDEAPWGFAPFHYGRWVWYRDVWSWAPGTYVARPVYAPALVAWVGGPRVSVSVSIGGGFADPSVGWFPLAPREVYVPSYRHSPGYVQSINITHVTNITNITNVVNAPVAQRDFSNRKFPHAVTVVPTSVMTGRQAVGPASAQLRDAPEVRELTREPGRHGALLAAPVAAPVALARGVDPRAGAAPGAANTTEANRAPPPPGRVNRPGQRNADYDRAVAPAAANPAAAAGNVAPPAPNPATAGAVRPAPATTAPAPAPAVAAVVTPPQPPQPSKRVLPARPVPEPAAQAVARPAPVPAPPMRGVPRPPTGQDGRSAGNAPGGPAPVQAVPRNPQVERPMPEKRHQAQPAVAAPPKPADAPSRARGEPREEQPERRQSPRDRNMTN